MRLVRFFFLFFFAGLGFAPVACSTSSTPLAPADAGSGNRALGVACDPAQARPCELLTDVCTVSMCDPRALVCVRVAVDGGPTCTNGSPPVTSCASSTCDAGDDGEADAPFEASGGDASGDAPDGASEAGDSGGDASVDARPEAGDAGGD